MKSNGVTISIKQTSNNAVKKYSLQTQLWRKVEYSNYSYLKGSEAFKDAFQLLRHGVFSFQEEKQNLRSKQISVAATIIVILSVVNYFMIFCFSPRFSQNAKLSIY